MLISILLFFNNWILTAQQNDTLLIENTPNSTKDTLISTKIPHTFIKTGALVSYYFWEEDSLGYILNNEVKQPYLQNYIITISPKKSEDKTIDFEKLSAIINVYSHMNTHDNEKNSFEFSEKERIHFPLVRESASKMGSVIYVKQDGKWKSQKSLSVHYFTINSENKWQFSHSSDSIILDKYNVKLASNGQYLVLTYLKDSKKINKQLVYTFNGENITDYILEAKSMSPEHVLVFANGYRGPTREKDESDHLVTNKDRYFYWFKIDNQFIKVLEPTETFYIDGSMKVNTSNHKTMVKFAISFFRASFILRKKRARKNYKFLNTTANIEGFQYRKDKGKIAGKAFLTALCNSPACSNTIDTLDIVCHSMGYAYSLGFIEEITGKVIFGKMYILAPENACTDGADWTLFEEVWQYGSNLDQENPDPIWEQDGIAPQCQVKGLENVKPGKGGRAFFPKDWPRKNFIDSHQPYNFDWIFERIKVGENGFISK